MFKIQLVPNMDRFLKVVEQCRGDVILSLPPRTSCSLKTNDAARQLLRTLAGGQGRLNAGIDIRLSDKRDFPAILRHMMEAAQH